MVREEKELNMKEKWYRIENHPNYEMNQKGIIRHIRTKCEVDPIYVRKTDEYKIKLPDRFDEIKSVNLQRIVAETFCGGPHNDCDVEFLDGNDFNFSPDNMRWIKTGRLVSKERKYIRVIETGETFDSIYECKDKLNIPLTKIKQALQHPRSTVGNYHLEFVVEDL